MGTRLLVATRTRGLQIVDVLDPIAPVLRGEFQTPPLLGVEQNGSSAALFLGEDGVLVVDVTSPVAVVARGPIAVPGVAHDGAWDGDTLLVAAGFALERYLVHPAPTVVPAITALFDEQGAQARARLTWDPVSLPGMIGLNVYRDLDPASSGTALPPGRLVNRTLLPLTAVEAIDDSLTAGRTHRYRLEAFFADGSSRKVAEGTLLPSASARVGRSAPNPFRPGRGALASIHYRLPAGTSGTLRLDVHGVSGRLLRTITAPVAVASGFGTVAWDGRDRSGRILPSGIYFLHLTGAGLDDSRAITLLR